ncbi:stimulator of interferon genes protein isoform 2-T2 [Morphnus guianensis]
MPKLAGRAGSVSLLRAPSPKRGGPRSSAGFLSAPTPRVSTPTPRAIPEGEEQPPEATTAAGGCCCPPPGPRPGPGAGAPSRPQGPGSGGHVASEGPGHHRDHRRPRPPPGRGSAHPHNDLTDTLGLSRGVSSWMAKPATSTQHCPVPRFPVGWETSQVPCVGGLWCFLQAACSLDSSFHFHFSWCWELCSSTRGTRSLYSAEAPGLCLRPKKSRGCPGWSTEPINPSAGKPRQRPVSWLVTAPGRCGRWVQHLLLTPPPPPRSAADVSGIVAAEPPHRLAHPQGPWGASAACRVPAPGSVRCSAVPRRGAPRARRPQTHRPLGSPADRGAAQGHLLPRGGGLPPPVQKPSAVEMSEMSEKSKQNVAHGLAWSYYVGYLKIVLPRVKKSMEEFSRANPNVLACRETWKLHILVPLSCDICDDLEKADSNIQYLTDLTEITLTRAGTKKRVYKHSVYAIRDEDNKLWHCAVEYATPLQSLYAMSQDECAAFSREDRLEQAKLFYRTLEEILKGSKECAGTYRLIVYEESGEAETHFLSREILWHLRQQHHEYTVYEGNHPHVPSTTLNSTELNLQISKSDLPQPLRSGCF